MTCSCCICAGLPLTRAFGGSAGAFDPTTTKTVTWADGLPGSVIVDGNGPTEMHGSAGWTAFNQGSAFAGSSVSFIGLDTPGVSVGTLLFPYLSQTDDPSDIQSAAGEISICTYGQCAAVSYQLTPHLLDQSINNPVFIDKSELFDDLPYESSANVQQQLHSETLITSFVGLSQLPVPTFVPSVLDLALSQTGTSLSEFTERPLDGLKDLLCWREVINTQIVGGNWPAKWNVQEFQSGGANQSPPVGTGYTLRHVLAFNDQTRLLLTPGTSPRPAWPIPVSISCLQDDAHANDDVPSTGLWTAAAFRPTYLDSAPPVSLSYGVTGPTGASVPFCNGHIIQMTRGDGLLYALSRDGVEVLPPTQAPTREQLYAATSENGAYLVTVTPTGSYGFPRTQLTTNKDFSSFVIDRTIPVVGFATLDDIFELTGEEGEQAPQSTVVTSTKPLVNPLCDDDESPSGVFARPCKNIWLNSNGTTVDVLSFTAGTYTLALPFQAASCVDKANNSPSQLFTQTWTVHGKHANYRSESLPGGHSYYGAVPSIEQPCFGTREYYRARLQTEKIESLLVTFDRPVDPSTVNESQVRLFCNGVSKSGCTIERDGESTTRWRIHVPLAEQQSATFCQLEYDPSDEVFTAETFTEIHYETQDDFPTDTTEYAALFRVVFIADDDGKRYSVSVNHSTHIISYVEIGNGNPLDWNGNPYNPEPSSVVARASWLMADMGGWPRLIDTSSTLREFVIGRAASISTESEIERVENTLALTSTGDIAITAGASPLLLESGGTFFPPPVLTQEPFTDFGLVASTETFDGFIPRMPTAGATGPYSYWGLGTTIDPAPPALIPPCAAPSQSQWHSSAIVCDQEILAFKLRVVLLDESANEIQPPADADGYAAGKVVFGQPGNLGWNGPAPGNFNHVANDLFPRIMASSDSQPPPPSITVGAEFSGYTLAQNLWGAVLDGGGVQINAMPMATVQAFFIDDNAVTSSPYWLQPEPHFRCEFESAEQTFGNSETTLEQAKEGLKFGVEALTPKAAAALSGSIRSVTDARYSFEGGQAVLSACRQAKTFPALKTTTLGPLVMTLSLRACIKSETDYADNTPVPSEFVYQVIDNGAPVQTDVPFEDAIDWVVDNFTQYDPEQAKWVLPPLTWVMYSTRGPVVEERTITERVLKDYTRTYTLTPDDEVTLASGGEITMPMGDGTYSIKLRRE